MKKKPIYYICIISIFASMAIVLEKLVTIRIGTTMKITLYALPILVMGIVHGKMAGLLTGLVTGIVLQLTSIYGVNITSIFWGLAPIGWGFVSGLVFEKLKCFSEKKVIIRYVISVSLAALCATILNTVAMLLSTVMIKDSGYTIVSIFADLPLRLLTMVVSLIPYIFITYIVCDRLKSYENK